MKILVINAGSSSLKYQLIDMDNEQMLAKGNCEKIGLEMGIFGHKTADGREKKIEIRMANHTEAFEQVKNALLDSEVGVIKDLSEVAAIGHRIVQGGALFSESVLVDEKVIEGIESLIPLAPLHNSAHVQGIRACMSVFGKEVPEVVVFDTAFHSTMPQKAYMFAVPYEYYEKYKIRRYGFHGTSHRYVSHRVAELMGKDIKDLKLITCHIGNGASVTAVLDGKSYDTSMGFSPLDGLVMGTRCGAIDASAITFIGAKEGMSYAELDEMMNKRSGVQGMTDLSSDMRDIDKAYNEGNPHAIVARDMYYNRVKKFVGAYAAEMICRAGVGRMTIVDADTVQPTNINRQLPALHSTLGQKKAEILASRFRDINPALELRVLPVFLKDENIPELLDDAAYDFVVDAIDTLAPKCHLIAESMKRHIKIVSSMGAGAKSDISQVRFADIWDTYHCGLSKAVRKRLQKMGIKRKLPVVFSTEQADPNAVLLTDDEMNKKSTCGTVSYMPAVFGCYLAEYVIKRL